MPFAQVDEPLPLPVQQLACARTAALLVMTTLSTRGSSFFVSA